MIDLRKVFGEKLKERIDKKKDTEEIGEWAFSFYWENIEEIDSKFRKILLTLNKMELGEEFAFTYEELERIADDLIAGKDVKL